MTDANGHIVVFPTPDHLDDFLGFTRNAAVILVNCIGRRTDPQQHDNLLKNTHHTIFAAIAG